MENRPSYAASTLVSNSLLQTASQTSYGLRTQSGDSSPTTQQNSVNSGSSGTQAVLLQTGQTFTVQQTSQQSAIQQQLPQQQTSYASPQTVQTVTQVGQQLSGQQVTYVQTASGALQSVHTSPVIQQRITTQQIANTNSARYGYEQRVLNVVPTVSDILLSTSCLYSALKKHFCRRRHNLTKLPFFYYSHNTKC